MHIASETGMFSALRSGYLLVVLMSVLGFTPVQTVIAEVQPLPDSAQHKTGVDTLRLLSDQPIKSPWGAVLRSAILPGWGQAYNEKYVKAVLALGLNGTLAWRISHYHKRWEDTNNTSNREKRNLYSWYLGLAYLITLVDAYVDATLFGFEEAMDISYSPTGRNPSSWAVSLRIQF